MISRTALICAGVLGLGQAAHAKWAFQAPAGLIQVSCSKSHGIFYLGDQLSFTASSPIAKYMIRDYWGTAVDEGNDLTHIRRLPVGWYKLYAFDAQGDIKGDTTFIIMRPDKRFPQMPATPMPSALPSEDEAVRGISGMGPQRYHGTQDLMATRRGFETDVAIDKQLYLPFDPYRKRVLFAALADGTKNKEYVISLLNQFKDDVKYWEPRNEPNFGATGKEFVDKELIDFYHNVKSVDKSLHVLSPGTVSINDELLPWIEDFLKAGGAKYIDGFSFHHYNQTGDAHLMRESLDKLNVLLAKYGADKLEKWQTEQGYYGSQFGLYWPRLQAMRTLLQLMVYEQYGIPKEHNHLWYDRSHGFWDQPTYWVNDGDGLNPVVALLRVYSEELYGKRFAKAYDFGKPGNEIFVGNLFTGPGGATAAFMSTGATDQKLTVTVNKGATLHMTSAMGESINVAVRNGQATFDVTEIPVYADLEPGQSIDVVKPDYGPNLAREKGTTAFCGWSKTKDIPIVIDGDLTLNKPGPFFLLADYPDPVGIDITLPKEQSINRVIVYCTPSMHSGGPLLDFEIQYDRGGNWVTAQHVKEPGRTMKAYSPHTKTSVDCFYSDRWLFNCVFPSVHTRKIRVLVHSSTMGGAPNQLAFDAGCEGVDKKTIAIREIELYSK